VVVGRDFRFGRGRAGTVTDLRELLKARRAAVYAVSPICLGRRVIQSTAIRRDIQAGRLAEARRMLGRAVEVSGRVVRGAGIGARLGARTVNVEPGNELLPRQGVYAGWMDRAGVGRAPGRKRPVVLNLGVAPTVQSRRRVLLEAHVIDGRRVVYHPGESVRVDLAAFLRPERKFTTAELLSRAIQKDITRAIGIVRGRCEPGGKPRRKS